MSTRDACKANHEHAYTVTQNKNGDNQTGNNLFRKGKGRLDIIMQIITALAAIGAVFVGVFFYYHKQTYGIWTVYLTTILLVSLPFLAWQNRVWKQQEQSHATPTPVITAQRVVSPINTMPTAKAETATITEKKLALPEYTQDVFNDVIWRWHYNPEIDFSPRDIKPYCPECKSPQLLSARISHNKAAHTYSVVLECPYHRKMHSLRYKNNPNPEPFQQVKTLIETKIKDGKWQDVVAKLRELKAR